MLRSFQNTMPHLLSRFTYWLAIDAFWLAASSPLPRLHIGVGIRYHWLMAGANTPYQYASPSIPSRLRLPVTIATLGPAASRLPAH